MRYLLKSFEWENNCWTKCWGKFWVWNSFLSLFKIIVSVPIPANLGRREKFLFWGGGLVLSAILIQNKLHQIFVKDENIRTWEAMNALGIFLAADQRIMSIWCIDGRFSPLLFAANLSALLLSRQFVWILWCLYVPTPRAGGLIP